MRLVELEEKRYADDELVKLIVFSSADEVSVTREEVMRLTGAKDARRLGLNYEEEQELFALPRAIEFNLNFLDLIKFDDAISVWAVNSEARSALARLSEGFRGTLSLPKTSIASFVAAAQFIAALEQARDALTYAGRQVSSARHYAKLSPLSPAIIKSDLALSEFNTESFGAECHKQVATWLKEVTAREW